MISEIFDYDFLRQHASIVQTGFNNYLKTKELYCVKISILRFLNKVCDSLIYNCEMTRENNKHDESINEDNFIGSKSEMMSIKLLL
jgi:hypothetical protein